MIQGTLRTPWLFDPWASFQDAEHATRATLAEEEHRLVARVELPGVRPDDIDVHVSEDKLTVSVGQAETHEDGHTVHHRFGAYRQTFRLPWAVDPESVVARSEHGVLEVTLSKPADSMPKRIPITASS